MIFFFGAFYVLLNFLAQNSLVQEFVPTDYDAECSCQGRAAPTRDFWDTLQQTRTHCNTLHHTATHCNTLQHTATHCLHPRLCDSLHWIWICVQENTCVCIYICNVHVCIYAYVDIHINIYVQIHRYTFIDVQISSYEYT